MVARYDCRAGSLRTGSDGTAALPASNRQLTDQLANCFCEIIRERCFQIHAALRSWMIETKFPRMQHLPREPSGTFSAVNRVPENRMAEMLKVHANLMSATTVQAAFQQAGIWAGAQHFEIGSRHAPAFARNGHLLTMNLMTRNGRDDASKGPPQFPGNKRQVNF